MQIEAALESARRKDTVSAYQAFLTAYADWPGGAAYLEQALDSEVKGTRNCSIKGWSKGLVFLKSTENARPNTRWCGRLASKH